MIVSNYNDRPNNLFKFDVSTSNNVKYNEEIVEDSKELNDYSIYSFIEEDNEDEFIEQEKHLSLESTSEIDISQEQSYGDKEKDTLKKERYSNSYFKYGQTFSDYKWNSFVAIPYGFARGLLIENEKNQIFHKCCPFTNEKISELSAKIANYILYRTKYYPDHKATVCREDICHALKINYTAAGHGLRVLKNAGVIKTFRKGNINGTNSIVLNEERMKEIENRGSELEKKDDQEYYKERSKTTIESIQRVINYQRKIKHIDENKYSF